MSNQNKNNIERDRSVYLDHMDEISNEELDSFFGFAKVTKDEKKAVKVPGIGVFTPFSRSRTPDDFPTFIDKTAEAQKRRRLKAIEHMMNHEDDNS